MRGTKPHLVVSNDAISNQLSAPKWFSAHAREEWDRVFPALVERKILTRPDLGMLESYCVAMGTVRECAQHLRDDGLMIKTEKGPKRHPAYGVQTDAMKTARQLASELGLTPVSRSRPTIRPDDENDEFGDYDL